ncbi:hypothetical protein PTKIN_Ptkin09bG0291900 [Pterospermum kingtungense]
MMLKVLVFVVLVSVVVNSQQPTFNDDVLGLIFFKAGLKDPYAKLQSWSEDDNDPCNWVGVKCDPKTFRVVELHLDGLSLSGHVGRGLLQLQFLQVLSLSNNNLTGTVNSELSRIWSLRVIDLSGNSLSGSIPDDFFAQCGSLRSVSLAKNNLTGKIPESLSYCSTLVAVNLSSNQISGKLPSGIWFLRSLQSLDMSGNMLEGDIAEGIGSLYDLRHIDLGNNRFSGRLPGDIGSCSLLKSVDFSENYLSGTLPDSMQRLGSCTSISLHGNSLWGQVPDWIGELTSLESLDLSANNFSGEVPFSLGNLQFLKELNLSMNHFTGALPESMATCSNLLAIDVSQNQLTGNVPSWMFKNQGLEVLDLSSNSLSGELPYNLGVLSSLLFFNMSRNHLSGSIPAGIGELKNTEVIDLSHNMLSGSIPLEIGKAVSLKELRLRRNFLSGKIPTQIVNCSSLTTLILSQNNLSGSIPPAISNLSSLQYVDLSSNDLTGGLPKELANLSLLISFNISHNHLHGELPLGGFFNIIPTSSVSGNPSLCGSVVNRSCSNVHPDKPIVLNPNSSNSIGGSSPNHHRKKIVLSISALIAIGAAAFIVIGVVAITVLNIHARSSMSRVPAALNLHGFEDFNFSPTNDPNYGKLVMFTGDADFVAGAHALLNKECEVGRGGFGVVYRTILGDGRSVAIKKLTVSSLIKSQEDFEREAKKLGRIRHHNLVALEGYYLTPSLHLLIYEFVSSESLYKHLHDNGTSRSCLSWRQRFNIILGMANGLAYLHRMNIIHYNLKSTNILLDSFGDAKVGDFGLARLLPTLDRCVLSSKIQSALGYMAPEFACKTVKITEKCDVYGFGVLVLEVITGKKPVEYMEDDVVVLSDMVRRALEEGKMEECVDGRLRSNFPAEEAIPVIKLGLICASQVPSNRPDMEEVVNILELIQCPSDGQEELD